MDGSFERDEAQASVLPARPETKKPGLSRDGRLCLD